MTKQKKFIIFLCIICHFFILFMALNFFVYRNFCTYCLYYAQNMPHVKDTNPEMAIFLDHLDGINDSNIQGLRFDSDGHNSIISETNDESLSQSVIPDDSIGYEFSTLDTQHESFRSYYFDKSGRFYCYSYMRKDENNFIYETSDQRKKEAQGYVDKIMIPIIKKNNEKPIINLQWLFNHKYQDRFSNT